MKQKSLVFFSIYMFLFSAFLPGQKMIAAKSELPDFWIRIWRIGPEEPCIDDYLIFGITVNNLGKATSPKSKAVFKVGGGAAVIIDLPEIKPGGKHRYQMKAKNFHIAQKYINTAYVDPGNKIKESNEDNNSYSLEFEVFDNCCPDLNLRHSWTTPKNPRAGEPFDIIVEINNIGKKANILTNMKIYVGGSTTPYILHIGSLDPKENTQLRQKISLSRKGKYVARVILDPDNRVRECREDNNSIRINFTVK